VLRGRVVGAPAHAALLKVDWMRGVAAPGTPARYGQVGVIKVGSSHARNVLVLEPGTSAGAAYFVPLAHWIVARGLGWQVSRCGSRSATCSNADG